MHIQRIITTCYHLIDIISQISNISSLKNKAIEQVVNVVLSCQKGGFFFLQKGKQKVRIFPQLLLLVLLVYPTYLTFYCLFFYVHVYVEYRFNSNSNYKDRFLNELLVMYLHCELLKTFNVFLTASRNLA